MRQWLKRSKTENSLASSSTFWLLTAKGRIDEMAVIIVSELYFMKPSWTRVFSLPRVTRKHSAILLANVRKRYSRTGRCLISKLL